MANIKLKVISNNFTNNLLVQNSNLIINSDATNIYFQASLNTTNIGGPNGIYLNTSNSTLNFKSLNAGSYLSITSTATTLVINTTNIIYNVGSYLSLNPSGTINNLSPDQILNLSSTTLAITSLYPNFILNYTGNSLSYVSGSYINIRSNQINNSAPDQVITLVGFNGVSITGIYPSYGLIGNTSGSGGGTVFISNTPIYSSIYCDILSGTKSNGNYTSVTCLLPTTGIFSRLYVQSTDTNINCIFNLLLNNTKTVLSVTVNGMIGSNITDVVVVKPLDTVALTWTGAFVRIQYAITYKNL